MKKHFCRLFAVALAAVALLPSVWAAGGYAPFSPTMAAGAAYVVDAHRLHPTQFCLGFREVAYKADLFNAMSAGRLAAFLQHKNVPVVIGPGGVPYLTDGHHTIRALLESRQPDKTVYGHILANWSALDPAAFWARMEAHHYAYLHDAEGRGPLDPAGLPDSLLHMQSDPYRSLAWGVLVRHGFREVKGPAGFFQEFHWGDFFRPRIRWDDRDDAAFARAVAQAVALAHQPAAAALPGYVPAGGAPLGFTRRPPAAQPPCSASQRSASIAAWQPMPAAVTA
jgi:hypothetical protein